MGPVRPSGQYPEEVIGVSKTDKTDAATYLLGLRLAGALDRDGCSWQ